MISGLMKKLNFKSPKQKLSANEGMDDDPASNSNICSETCDCETLAISQIKKRVAYLGHEHSHLLVSLMGK